jgi:hypothetical protein
MMNQEKKQQNMARKMTLKQNNLFLFIIFNFLFVVSSWSQEINYKRFIVDSVQIMNKAKLLTISKYGVENYESIIEKILSQEAYLYNTDLPDYLIINIKSNQNNPIKIKGVNGEINKYCGENLNDSLDISCNYVIVFSNISYRFFKIKGFDICELEALERELDESIYLINQVFSNKLLAITSIDLDCMYSTYGEEKKHKKKLLDCYKKCDSCLEEVRIR